MSALYIKRVYRKKNLAGDAARRRTLCEQGSPKWRAGQSRADLSSLGPGVHPLGQRSPRREPLAYVLSIFRFICLSVPLSLSQSHPPSETNLFIRSFLHEGNTYGAVPFFALSLSPLSVSLCLTVAPLARTFSFSFSLVSSLAYFSVHPL